MGQLCAVERDFGFGVEIETAAVAAALCAVIGDAAAGELGAACKVHTAAVGCRVGAAACTDGACRETEAAALAHIDAAAVCGSGVAADNSRCIAECNAAVGIDAAAIGCAVGAEGAAAHGELGVRRQIESAAIHCAVAGEAAAGHVHSTGGIHCAALCRGSVAGDFAAAEVYRGGGIGVDCAAVYGLAPGDAAALADRDNGIGIGIDRAAVAFSQRIAQHSILCQRQMGGRAGHSDDAADIGGGAAAALDGDCIAFLVLQGSVENNDFEHEVVVIDDHAAAVEA